MRRCAYGLVPLVALAAVLALTQPALAVGAGPARWAITSASGPAYFKPASSKDVYVVTATNVGGEPASGPVTIEDTLPEGIRATQAPNGSAEAGNGGEAFTNGSLKCPESPPPSSFTCVYADEPGHEVAPGDTLTFTIPVEVTSATGEVENTATVSGGGTASATTSQPTSPKTKISPEQVPFGVASFFATPSTTQAGGYANFTTRFALNLTQAHRSAGSPRQIDVDLPPGLTGDPRAVPTCNIDYVRRILCPRDTAVGVATAVVGGGGEDLFAEHQVVLVYNIKPYEDEPAAFAFSLVGGSATVRLDTSVIQNSDGEYAVHVSVPEVSQLEPVVASSVTLWGVPADYNGPGPDITNEHIFREGKSELVTFGRPSEAATLAKPFMRNPTRCAGPLTSTLLVKSWPGPVEGEGEASSAIPAPSSGFSECGVLSPLFSPSIAVAPDTTQAGAPAGYGVNLELPQSESAERLATPDLEDVTVTLPQGTVASPSAANGLDACSDAQFDKSSQGPASCPQKSAIGEVRIKTPLLEEELSGQVFLGQPECSPCGSAEAQEGSMVRLFLQAEGSGVRVKLAGRTEINQATGQLTTLFERNPQQPVSAVRLKLENGPGAPLANPTSCGTATTTSRLTPWNGGAPAEPSSSFTVSFDGAGAGCPSSLPFAPSFDAHTSIPAAGGYSPFSVTFARNDREQNLAGITVQTPPGLLGMVSHVTRCPEPQANAGTCSPASEIGSVTAAVGPGPVPYDVTGGRAYLTGPYGGAPFGLSIVVPAVAGPFNLGYEVVRAAIHIDPHTAALTVVSNPLPQMKDGIPFQVKAVSVDIDRPEFIFNPTNCAGGSIRATISGNEGAAVPVSTRFGVGGCAGLPFKPSFTVSTQGRTSKANGASLDVKVAEKPGEANIHKVDTQLPLALPSRLTTLQKACSEAQFAANPAGCPAASNVGMAVAHTPVLNAPLVGPAYLVSHGGAAFPDLDIVLQGEGITIDLTGNTDIKKGITFSRFETVPDAPISTFELNLPEGPHSALAAFGNLCEKSLVMPTTIVGQNGAQDKQSTRITVGGCPPRVSVKKARVKGNVVFLTVTNTQKAALVISGRGLKTTKKTLGAGTHLIKVPLTRVGKAARKGHKKAKIRVSAKNTQDSTSTTTSVSL